MNYVGGNLAAVLLWFLWLRRGRLGAIASSLRAFDRVNKPARKFSVDWPLAFVFLASCAMGTPLVYAEQARKTGAQDSKTGRDPDPPQHANGTGETPTKETKEDAANDKETREGNAANSLATGSDDRAPENEND